MSKITSESHDEAASVVARLAELHTQLSTNDPQVQSVVYDELLELASRGSGEAMYLVARCLMTGRGVKPNQQAGQQWLVHAVSAPVPSCAAFYSLGLLHLNSVIEFSNPAYGIGLLAKAFEYGHQEALPELLRRCNNSAQQLDAQKATYRVLGTHAAQPGASKSALEEFKLFCRAFNISELLDS